MTRSTGSSQDRRQHHRVHRSGHILRNRGEQASGDADVQDCQFRYRVQLYPREAFPPEIHGSHPYCLRNNQDARPQGVITLKSDQRDGLACENASLTHAGMLGEKEAQRLATKVAKTHGGGTPAKTVMPGPSVEDTPKTLIATQKHSMTVTLHQPSAPPVSWWPMRERGPQTKRFGWTRMMLTKSFVLVWS
jgi:hypothetical protein